MSLAPHLDVCRVGIPCFGDDGARARKPTTHPRVQDSQMVSEADSTQTDGTAEHESTPALARLCRQLLQDVPIDFLVVYRVAFGHVMCWWAISNLRNGVPYNSYTSTPFHFTYYGFDWIQPPEIQLALGGVALDGMSLLFIAFAGLAICI